MAAIKRPVTVIATSKGTLRAAHGLVRGGVTDQPPFLNAAAMITTGLAPHALLRAVKHIERAAGRTAGPRWGPRPLDIDLLLYDDQRVNTPDLIIPHPRLAERRFVLAPLQDLRPDWHDATGRPLAALLAAVADQPVTPVATGPWWEDPA